MHEIGHTDSNSITKALGRCLLGPAYQDRDGTMDASYCEPASVFVHDLPIVSHHDEQKQEVISEGDNMLSY